MSAAAATTEAQPVSYESVSADRFTHTTLPVIGKRVHRLGLAGNYGIDEKGIRAALDRGLNYVLYTERAAGLRPPLREALKARREEMVVAVLPTLGFFAGNIRRGCEKALKALDTDYLDVYQLGWLGVGSALTEGTAEALLELKREGKIRAIGCSIHDRPRAGNLAEESVMDLLMIRYNAAHPGAERDIFPKLGRRNPAVIAYTATGRGALLKTPRGWGERVPDAGDCYRFALSSPHVTVTLTGPGSERELDENLRALERGPLSQDEHRWMRSFGRAAA